MRPYALAGLPSDADLEVHVEHVAGGAMSGYLCGQLRAGDSLRLRGPDGECVYVVGRPEQPLILAGAGTGVAPLIGIARDALARRHRGPIVLCHGPGSASALYADEDLRALSAEHANLRYVGCPSPGRFDAEVGAAARLWRDARAFLCGAPVAVERLRRELGLAGLREADILTEPFSAATS
jgi:ferredoxin-NADP reductase